MLPRGPGYGVFLLTWLRTLFSPARGAHQKTGTPLSRQEMQFWSNGVLVQTVSGQLTVVFMPFLWGLHIFWLDRDRWCRFVAYSFQMPSWKPICPSPASVSHESQWRVAENFVCRWRFVWRKETPPPQTTSWGFKSTHYSLINELLGIAFNYLIACFLKITCHLSPQLKNIMYTCKWRESHNYAALMN